MTQIELARLLDSASWRTPGTAAAEVGGQNGPPFSAMAFVSNDEVYHRIVFFETPGPVIDPDKRRHARLQHKRS